MPWGIETDPVTVGVLAFVAAFSVLNWLRWRSKAAWFDRVVLERTAEDEE